VLADQLFIVIVLFLIYNYCKTSYFRCILIFAFWNVEILLQSNFAFSQCSSKYVFTQPLVGKLNFHGYIILRFYPIRKICENFMHMKIIWFTVPTGMAVVVFSASCTVLSVCVLMHVALTVWFL